MSARLLSASAICAGYLAVFLLLHGLHFYFFPVHVVLYDAVLDAILAAILTAALLVHAAGRLATTGLESGLALVIGFLLALLFCVSIPTIIDRSLSVYVLEKLVQRGGAIRQAAFEEIIKQEFMQEHRVTDIRLTEQVNSGTIQIVNGCVRLTPRGERIAAFSRFYRTNLLPKQREIMGLLTDDLTDPFRRSTTMVAFACE
jgi:hypothetical protein